MNGRVVAYVVGGLFCARVLFLSLRTFAFRDGWPHNQRRLILKNCVGLTSNMGRSKTATTGLNVERCRSHRARSAESEQLGRPQPCYSGLRVRRF